jgi:hypothetical protein
LDPKRLRIRLCLGALVGLLLPLSMSAPAAAVTYSSSVTMMSEPGDYIGQGRDRVFNERNGAITVTGDAGYLQINVSGGTLGDYYHLDVAAPPGELLHPGLYTGVQRAAFRTAKRAGLDIAGSGRGCNEVGGRFDVKDIVLGPNSTVSRLWMTYEQHCENGPAALFGEIRLSFRDPGSVLPLPGELTWPDVDVGRGGAVVPVMFLNLGPNDVTFTGSSTIGSAKSDFQVRLDECNGVTIGTGESCNVWVRFGPSVAGPRFAWLQVTDAGGGWRRVLLEGNGIGGLTQVTMQSDSGDYIGGGASYSYTPANSQLSIGGSRSYVHVGVTPATGGWWDLDFEAPANDILAPGDYPNATRYPFNGTGPGLDVSGMGRGCNELTGSFHVTAIAFNTDETLKYFGTTFEQHCEGGTPALRGEVDYRVPTGDTTAPAGVSNLQLTRSGRLATVSWTNPTDADYARTIVRWVYGTTPPGSPTSGQFLYVGRGTGARFGVGIARPLTVSVFTVDAAGNASRAATATVPAG